MFFLCMKFKLSYLLRQQVHHIFVEFLLVSQANFHVIFSPSNYLQNASVQRGKYFFSLFMGWIIKYKESSRVCTRFFSPVSSSEPH
jgi:hypothetical protein